MGQIKRIISKLAKAKKKDNDLEIFGAKSHQYFYTKPLTIDKVEKFEKKYAIKLPKDYKRFITEIGNEGISYSNCVVDKSCAGPYYGIFPLEKNNDYFETNPLIYLQKSVTIKQVSAEKWYTITEDFPDDDQGYQNAINKLFSGILPIGSMGCSGALGLVLNGEYEGQVGYFDLDLGQPFFTGETFLNWYERWLDEIIQDTEFLENLNSELTSKDEHRILRALESLFKFDKIEDTSSLIPLLNQPKLEIRAAAFWILTKHNAKKATPYLLKFLEDSDDEKALISCKAIHWYVKNPKYLKQWSKPVLKRLEIAKSDKLLDFGFYILKNTKADTTKLLQKLVCSENENFRNTAYYNIGQLDDNSSFNAVLKKGLSFENPQISINVLQAINSLNDESYIPHYKMILQRIPNDQYIISNVINSLKEIGIEAFDDELQNYIKIYFDSIEDDSDFELSNNLINFQRIPLPKLLEHATYHSDKKISEEAKRMLKELNASFLSKTINNIIYFLKKHKFNH